MAVFRQLTEQYFDNSGNPLNGGLVYTYSAGTTTPKATYTDAGGLTSNANPVVLDSAGRASIWLNGNYKIVLKTSAGVTLKTEDNIAGYAEVDFTGLTSLASELNFNNGAIAGTVVASKVVVPDTNKDIGNFRNLTGVNLIATTKTTSPIVQTPLIYDNNGVAAVTITSTASQVNSVTLTPAATTNHPKIAASGTDTNPRLDLSGKGTGGVRAIVPGAGTPLSLNANGVAFDSLIALATLTANRTVTLPDQNLSKFLVNYAYSFDGAVATGTTVIPADDTIPQSGEGDQYYTVSITPQLATNILVVYASLNWASSVVGDMTLALFRDAGADAVAATGVDVPVITNPYQNHLVYIVAAGAVTATTFKLRAGNSAAGTTTVNGVTGARRYGGVGRSGLLVLELSA